jgi:hypothetical protein
MNQLPQLPSQADLKAFVKKFGNLTEEYNFYNGEVTLRYDVKKHIYYLVTSTGLHPVESCSSVGHIIDKSAALVPWACKMMGQKLLDTIRLEYIGEPPIASIRQYPLGDFTQLVNSAKSAHKEKLDDAGNIGTIAHDWVEHYIKACIKKDQDGIERLLADMPTDERASNACIAALDWMQRHNVRWLCTERKVYSRKYKFAGTMDGLCLVDSCSNPKCCKKEFTNHLTVADWKTSNGLYVDFLLQTAGYMAAYIEETQEPVVDRWIIRLGKEDAKFEPWYLPYETQEEDFRAFLTALDLTRLIASLETRIATYKKHFSDNKKQNKQEVKDSANKIKCKNADKYKGQRRPTCNNGNPCETCLARYSEVQANKDTSVIKLLRT